MRYAGDFPAVNCEQLVLRTKERAPKSALLEANLRLVVSLAAFTHRSLVLLTWIIQRKGRSCYPSR
jgi:DNA-directed RNA polymerase sigma subunit (sigma70/sigma32)